jgi:hypothetical protein
MISKIRRKVLAITERVESAITGYLFDRSLGVETRKILDRFSLDVEENTRAHAWSYEPCSYPRFKRIMKMIPEVPERLTFVDIGSGKGRQLIAASLYGFRRVIGIEVSPTLRASAQQNVATFMLRKRSKTLINIENMDATQYVLPSEACLLFMFNPFQEPAVRSFLASIKVQINGRKQPLYVAYIHPTVRSAFDESNIFELIAMRSRPTDAVIYKLRPPCHNYSSDIDKAEELNHTSELSG